jgi:hypothetical protein
VSEGTFGSVDADAAPGTVGVMGPGGAVGTVTVGAVVVGPVGVGTGSVGTVGVGTFGAGTGKTGAPVTASGALITPSP